MIKFLDLYAQYLPIKDEINSKIALIISSSAFIGGKYVAEFEKDFAKYQEAGYCVGVGNGTDALEIAIESLCLPKGSEIIVPANSFIASAEAISRSGNKIVFCDINPYNYTLNLKDVQSKITKKTSAIVAVHLYGHPCNMDLLLKIACNYKLKIIEDCAQAHGAEYKGKKVGSLGDVGCFSFYPTKNMTVGGDGGMTTTDNEETALKIKSIRDNGRKTKNEFDKLGFTMRLNTVNAAIGRVQLKHIDEKTARRREIVSIYRKNLAQDCILPENKDGKSVYHQIVIKHEKRDDIRKKLTENEIGSAIYYETPIHRQPIYQEFGYKLPNSEKFSKKIISLPSYPQLTDDQALEICECVNKVID